MWILLSLLVFFALVVVPAVCVLFSTLDSLPRSNDDWFFY